MAHGVRSGPPVDPRVARLVGKLRPLKKAVNVGSTAASRRHAVELRHVERLGPVEAAPRTFPAPERSYQACRGYQSSQTRVPESFQVPRKAVRHSPDRRLAQVLSGCSDVREAFRVAT
jgi:hypothetical protein